MSTAPSSAHTNQFSNRATIIQTKLHDLHVKSSLLFSQTRASLAEETALDVSRPIVRLPSGIASTLRALFKGGSMPGREEPGSGFGAVGLQGASQGFGAVGGEVMTPPLSAEAGKGDFERKDARPMTFGRPSNEPISNAERSQRILLRMLFGTHQDLTIEASDGKTIEVHKAVMLESSPWMATNSVCDEPLKLAYPIEIVTPMINYAYGMHVGMLHDLLPHAAPRPAQYSDLKHDASIVQDIEKVQQLLAAATTYQMTDLASAASHRLLQMLDCCDDHPRLIVAVASGIYSGINDEQMRQQAAKSVVKVLQHVTADETVMTALMGNVKLARDVMFQASQGLKTTTAPPRAPIYEFGTGPSSLFGQSNGSPFSAGNAYGTKSGTTSSAGGFFGQPARASSSLFQFPPNERSSSPPVFPRNGGESPFNRPTSASSRSNAPPSAFNNPASSFQRAPSMPAASFGFGGGHTNPPQPAGTFFGVPRPSGFAPPSKPQTNAKAPPPVTAEPAVDEYFSGMSSARLKRLAEPDSTEDEENKKQKTDGP